uniref:Uncharacterized protein n=1 Tax=Anopheles farauti TaxID=69004 RepID=A0A182QNU9_9DIPT
MDEVNLCDRKCLTYLLTELQRILNPKGNKFVLLVTQAFREYDRNYLKQLKEALCNLGVGYSLLLSYARANSTGDPTLMTRISFQHMVTTSTADFSSFQDSFRLDLRSLDGMKLTARLINYFPFSYKTSRGHWDGTDFYMWSIMAGQLRLRLQMKYTAPGTSRKYEATDLIATRDMVVNDGLPKIYLGSRDYFCLMVPRPLQLHFIDALLQPFQNEVWILIGVLVGLRIVVGMLHVVGIYPKIIFHLEQPWYEWLTLASDVLTFLLVEAYLAQVTSLLLTLRYVEGPKSLDQFLAANISILEPFGQELSLAQVKPAQRALLKTRMVQRTTEERRSIALEDAYLEIRSRVMFLPSGKEPIDPVTGRRNYYILDEPLAVMRFQYSFTKDTAFKMVAERCLLQYEENGLRMHMDRFFERWAKIEHMRKQNGLNGTVLGFADLRSLWISDVTEHPAAPLCKLTWISLIEEECRRLPVRPDRTFAPEGLLSFDSSVDTSTTQAPFPSAPTGGEEDFAVI